MKENSQENINKQNVITLYILIQVPTKLLIEVPHDLRV